MLCYRDMTFCDSRDCADWDRCPRAYTEKVKRDAEAWMKDPPVCFFAEKPECFKEKV